MKNTSSSRQFYESKLCLSWNLIWSHNFGDNINFLQESISVILPADVAIFEYPEVEPVNPAPVLPEAVEIPSQFSPLVKLTINVNSQQVITSIIKTLLKYCCSFLF